MPYRVVNRFPIHYLDFPKRAHSVKHEIPVVLIHGLGANSYSWLLQMPALLEAGFRVLAPDLRGFGQSGRIEGRVSISTFAMDLVQLIAATGIERIHLVGISMGGAVALQLAVDFPHLVQRLVLINTAPRFRPDSARTAFYFLWRLVVGLSRGIDRQAEIVAEQLFHKPGQDFFRQTLVDQILSADRRAYRQSLIALFQFDLREEVAGICVPTLVLTGMEDNTISPGMQKYLMDTIPGARQVLVPGAGHGVTAEEPARTNAALLDFLVD